MTKNKNLPSKIWLMKSEPDVYSIDHLKKDQCTLWTGVRNYQARNFMMKEMSPGDTVIFYHSNAEPPGIAGYGRVKETPIADPTQFEPKSEYFDPKSSPSQPRWFCAKIEYKEHAKNYVPLEQLKKNESLSEMLVLKKGQRLSIQPVSLEHFKIIQQMTQNT